MKSPSLAALAAFAILLPVSADPGLESSPPWEGSNLEGTGAVPMPLEAIPIFNDLPWDNALYMLRTPGEEEHYLVLERWGTIWLLDAEKGTRESFLQLGAAYEAGKKQRDITALSLAFHPKFPEVPHLFAFWNQKANGKGTNRLSRFRILRDGAFKIDPGSEETLLEFESDGHNGGDLKFGPDGMLYLSSGDGSSPGDPENIGQTTDNFLGSILRIDVNKTEGDKPYRVPPDNPFVGVSGILPEVYAYGLRNPWRMEFRPDTDELWVGDNGDEQWELVRKIGGGENHGWSAFEGSHPFRQSNKLAGPATELTLPAVEHPHTDMRSVIGGLWYRGKRFPDLKGWYLYGCYFTGKVWGFPLGDGTPGQPVRLADTRGQIVGFSETGDREVLVVTLDRGILRLEKSATVTAPRPIPNLLSETGLFDSTEDHRPSGGTVPYGINAPAFWDGARRERFLAVPKGGKIGVEGRPPDMNHIPAESLRSTVGLDRWQLPGGSTLFQTFFLGDGEEKRKVETQVSLNDGGEWRFLSYRWNEDQSDAVLVPESGETAEIDLGDRKQTWKFSARAECAVCHTQRTMFVLGFNYGQLNRDFDYGPVGGKTGNQIETFHHLGFFREHFKLPTAEKMAAMPNPGDESLSLEDRARSYLHIHCAHCHRESGVGGRADFELLHWLPTDQMNVLDRRPLVGLPGIDPSEARLIVPGAPEKSEIYRRMVAKEFGRMPLLGCTQIDEEGADLIKRWIGSMAEPKPTP